MLNIHFKCFVAIIYSSWIKLCVCVSFAPSLILIENGEAIKQYWYRTFNVWKLYCKIMQHKKMPQSDICDAFANFVNRWCLTNILYRLSTAEWMIETENETLFLWNDLFLNSLAFKMRSITYHAIQTKAKQSKNKVILARKKA